MNILGHNYVAYRVIGRLNQYTAAGSEIPDIVPFVEDSVFAFEEIHESGNKLLKFLNDNYPKKRDLALAIMVHSVKFGADKFNREIIGWLLVDNEDLRNEIAKKISECANIHFEDAYTHRMHNYLWVGMDVYLMKKFPEFVEQLNCQLSNINVKEISNILSDFFNVDSLKATKNIQTRLTPYKDVNLGSLEGYTESLKMFHAGLPEKTISTCKKQSFFLKKSTLCFKMNGH